MKKILNTLKSMLSVALLATILVGCSKDSATPKPPTNEKEDKGHEEPSRVEFTIRQGHLHGVKFHGNPESIIAPVQQFKFELDEASKNWVRKDMNGKILTENAPVIMIEGAYYAMEIVYYNSNGKRINSEFTTKEMLPIHQHFFEVDQYTDVKANKVEKDTDNLLDYTYRDTDPENVAVGDFVNPKGSTLKSELTNNPLGLKGYFAPKIAYIKFNLQISLFHVIRGIKNVNNQAGQFYPFNKPGDELLARSTTDFSQKIPVYVITKTPGGGTEDANRFYQEVADYYKITPERVKELINEARKNQENSSYWM
ncbi:hypothetical protein RCZ04_20290 [Capnocytophaga sp. HP1101]